MLGTAGGGGGKLCIVLQSNVIDAIVLYCIVIHLNFLQIPRPRSIIYRFSQFIEPILFALVYIVGDGI